VPHLRALGHDVLALSRRTGPGLIAIGSCTPATDFTPLLAGADAIVHLMARVHAPASAPELYDTDNVEVPLALARAAAAAGVNRFVFVSSVKVMGDISPSAGFVETDTPQPADAYGRSKLAAERGLRALARETGLELVTLRPPLIHGPGARANLAALLGLVRSGWPLPFGAIDNRRSLIGLDNFVDLIGLTLIHPSAPGQVFFASDRDPVSTPELIRRIAHADGRPARLLPVPPTLIRAGLSALGRRGLADRLLGTLAVDESHLARTLGWTPRLGLDEGLLRFVRGEPPLNRTKG
jgi:nucleoside-diphosphate-sugar epimerase